MMLSPARLLLGISAAAILLASGCQPSSESNGRSSDAPANANVSVSVTSGNTAARADVPTSPAAMSPVPAVVLNTEIKTLDGKSVRLSDYAGKVVILDLWATWCPPCRKEIPHLIELSNEYKSRGVEVIGITMEDPQADLKKVQDFVKEFSINYKVGWATREMALGILEMSGRDTIPQTLIITRDGRVIKHIVGFNPIRTPDSMRETLEQAIKL
ncbi:MAG: TlpA disulfide reductase family protein [Pyrinomonadaceae bacterium]